VTAGAEGQVDFGEDFEVLGRVQSVERVVVTCHCIENRGVPVEEKVALAVPEVPITSPDMLEDITSVFPFVRFIVEHKQANPHLCVVQFVLAVSKKLGGKSRADFAAGEAFHFDRMRW